MVFVNDCIFENNFQMQITDLCPNVDLDVEDVEDIEESETDANMQSNRGIYIYIGY